MSKFIKKLLASFKKRYYMLTNGGFSVGKSYGMYMLFDWRHSIDKKVALQLYEHEQLSFVQGMIKDLKPDYFFDIGAHAGLYSLLVQLNSSRTQVHAFEPDNQNLGQLHANLYLNRFNDKVFVHGYAISDTSGAAYLDRSSDTSRGTRRLTQEGSCQIEVKRFDDMQTDTGKTAFFKIDVEGHELSVIEGAQTFLQNNACILLIESSNENIGILRERLQQLGYREIMVGKFYDYVFQNKELIKA